MALAVPLSRFTSRVGGGSAFFVRPRETLGICCESDWQAEIFGGSVFGEIGSRHFGPRTARADLSAAGKCGSLSEVRQRLLSDGFMKIYATWPNKAPEPTPVTPALLPGSRRLADVIRPAWLSFLR